MISLFKKEPAVEEVRPRKVRVIYTLEFMCKQKDGFVTDCGYALTRYVVIPGQNRSVDVVGWFRTRDEALEAHRLRLGVKDNIGFSQKEVLSDVETLD